MAEQESFIIEMCRPAVGMLAELASTGVMVIINGLPHRADENGLYLALDELDASGEESAAA